MTALDLLAVLGVVSVPAYVALGAAWLGARREARLRAELMQHASLRAPDRDDARRLEHSMESIALEVERIAESQRYVMRLLAERVASDAPAAPLPRPAHLPPGSPGRTITPH